jgi:hypothetical protein
MSDQTSDPLDPRLLELLRAHAPPLHAPAEALERVAARLAAEVPGRDAGHGGSPGAGAPAAPAGGPATAGGVGMLGAKGLLPIALAFAVGAGAGVALTRAREAPVERVVYVDRPAPLAPASAEPLREDAPASVPVESLPLAPSITPRTRATPSSTASSAPTAPTAPTAPAAPRASTDGIAVERALLDEARDALRRGDAEACLEAVGRHKARYPAGGLAEEREALAVRALVDSGRAAEARERANAFVVEYPASLLRPAVEAAVSSAHGKP